MLENKKRYYNDIYLKKIMNLVKEYRLVEAINEFQKYLEVYPEDIAAYNLYADALIRANSLEMAELVLNKAKSLFLEETSDKVKKSYYLALIKLLLHQKKYQKCFNNVKKCKKYTDSQYSYKYLILFLKKKLGLLNEEDLEQNIYSLRQIVSYNELEALEYIRINTLNNNVVHFKEDFPLESIYVKIREMLPLESKMIKNIVNDAYIFKYDANGHVKGKLVDYIEVVTIANSDEIIKMYPYENREKRNFSDLNPNLEGISRMRRFSQIDKFNQRYNKK